MSSTKFMAVVPQTVQAGDKILIKGKTKVDAKQFSINFANDTEASPQNITYHFKWILTSDRIVENYKMNGIWMDHLESDYNALDGPTFALEFAFQDDGIYTYLADGDGRNLVSHYHPEFELADIESVQVWGDAEKINELTFSYK